MNDQLTIYTIGHSTRSETEFVELLKSRSIARVIDVEPFPVRATILNSTKKRWQVFSATAAFHMYT